MHILIAPNAFKNSLTAAAAADAIRTGLEQSRLNCVGECFPIGDGGDGTGELLIDRLEGQHIRVAVQDPLGRPITASYGLVQDSTAIIEMTSASGIRLLTKDELNPIIASTTGTGQTIAAALEGGARQIFLAVGGSATVDCGAGILHALGARFLDAQGRPLNPIPDQLIHLASVDLSSLHPLLRQAQLTILCDVDNPLLGAEGAAAVFGPQKGAAPAMVQQLEAALMRLRDVVLATTGKDISSIRHGGAAGGTAAGCWALLDAKLVPGADYFLQLTGFEHSLQKADLVITGEGSLDAQTLQGKGPYAVARLAREKKIPVIGLAGRVPLHVSALEDYFDILLAIGNEPAPLAQALAATKDNLVRTARTLGNLLALKR